MLDLGKAKPTDIFWHTKFQELAEYIECGQTLKNAFGKTANLADVLKAKEDKEFCIYLSGPMSQKQFMGVAEFYEARQTLKKFGVKVIMPHEVIKPDTEWLDAVIQSLSAIKEATVVCSLEAKFDPQKSYGTAIETLACVGADVFSLDYKAMLKFMAYTAKQAMHDLDFL